MFLKNIENEIVSFDSSKCSINSGHRKNFKSKRYFNISEVIFDGVLMLLNKYEKMGLAIWGFPKSVLF